MDTDLVQVIEMLLESSMSSETSVDSTSSSSSGNSVRNHIKIKTFLDTIISYSDNDFVAHFRLRRNTAKFLIDQYSQFETFKQKLLNKGGPEKLSADKEICIFLWYMGNTEPLRTISNLFGVSPYCAWTTVNRVASFIISIGHNHVRWSNQISNQEAFKDKSGIENVIGAIDCTDICIKAPVRNKEDYFNRKKFYSVKLQAVVDAQKKFQDIFGGEPGSLHDSRMLRRSPLYRISALNANLFGDRFFIIGDSAYPCMEWLITPYRDTGSLTRQQRRFNNLHSSTRIVVEHAFGLLKGRFRRSQFFTEHQNINIVINIITAGCILHNICITNSDELVTNFYEPGPIQPDPDDFSEPHNNRSDRREEVLQQLIDVNLL